MGYGPNYSLEIPIPIPSEREFEEGYADREAIAILNGLPIELIFEGDFLEEWENGEVKAEFEGLTLSVRYINVPCEYLGNTGDSVLLISKRVDYAEPLTVSKVSIAKLIKLAETIRDLFPDLPTIDGYTGAHTI